MTLFLFALLEVPCCLSKNFFFLVNGSSATEEDLNGGNEVCRLSEGGLRGYKTGSEGGEDVAILLSMPSWKLSLGLGER